MNILEELPPLKHAVCHWNCADLQGTLFAITLSHIYVYIVLQSQILTVSSVSDQSQNVTVHCSYKFNLQEVSTKFSFGVVEYLADSNL